MKLKNILAERTVTKFRTKVQLDVNIQVDASPHAEDRQGGRTGYNDERGHSVSDSEIRASVIKATDKILQHHLNGELKDGERFVIYDPSQEHLNLVCVFKMNSGTPEKIDIVTVMKNDNFKSNRERVIKV